MLSAEQLSQVSQELSKYRGQAKGLLSFVKFVQSTFEFEKELQEHLSQVYSVSVEAEALRKEVTSLKSQREQLEEGLKARADQARAVEADYQSAEAEAKERQAKVLAELTAERQKLESDVEKLLEVYAELKAKLSNL